MPLPDQTPRFTFATLDPKIEVDRPGGPDGECWLKCPVCGPVRKRNHQNRRPLGVNLTTGLFWCIHCGAKGSLSAGWTQGGERGRVEKVQDPRPLRPAPPPRNDEDSPEEKGWKWFELQRRIPRALAQELGVRIVEDWCPICDDETGDGRVTCVAFPYFSRGKHVHTKYRDGHKHFWSTSGTKRVLYGEDALLDAELAGEPIIIVEGEIDLLSMRKAGYRRSVSMPDGAGSVSSAYKRAEKVRLAEDGRLQKGVAPEDVAAHVQTPWLADDAVAEAFWSAERVIIAVDSDRDGGNLSKELARRIGMGKCRRVVWPEGVKDANECLTLLGEAALREAVAGAEPFPVEGLLTIGSFRENILHYYEHGIPLGYSTGWPTLDSLTRVVLGQLWIWHGAPGSGKSHLLNAVLAYLMQEADMRCAICSPEWQPVEFHGISFVETITGKPFDRGVHGPERAVTRAELDAALDLIEDRVTFVLPRTKSMEVICDRLRMAILRRGAKVVVIDPMSEIRSEKPMEQYAFLNHAVPLFADVAKEMGVSAHLVVHPTKPQRKEFEDGKIEYLPQGMYGPAGSPVFAQMADVVIEVVRSYNGSNSVTLHVEKVRSRYHGKVGRVTLRFDPETGRYAAAGEIPDEVRTIAPADFKPARMVVEKKPDYSGDYPVPASAAGLIGEVLG